jgi:hypothetical protein
MRNCSHMYPVNRCPISGCTNFDNRSLVEQLFGKSGSNSALAARIARDNPTQYKQLQEEGRALGLLPSVKIPPCFQD